MDMGKISMYKVELSMMVCILTIVIMGKGVWNTRIIRLSMRTAMRGRAGWSIKGKFAVASGMGMVGFIIATERCSTLGCSGINHMGVFCAFIMRTGP
jgi:hypothetical protein